LRVLVEEYYKRRYPNDIAGDRTLGRIIEAVQNAAAPSPLIALQPLAAALNDFNEYASQYHHENPEHAAVRLNEDELRHYVQGALSLIYDDGTSHPIIAS
jgi:hypothetical protein